MHDSTTQLTIREPPAQGSTWQYTISSPAFVLRECFGSEATACEKTWDMIEALRWEQRDLSNVKITEFPHFQSSEESTTKRTVRDYANAQLPGTIPSLKLEYSYPNIDCNI